MNIKLNQTNRSQEAETIKDCIEISLEHPGKYILAVPCFGLYAEIHNRLNVHSPGDTPFNWYILNGKLKKFSTAQKIAEQNACIGRN